MWILFTLFAATMQAIRTAGQKHLTQRLSPIAVTWVRFGYGLPFALIYLFSVAAATPSEVAQLQLTANYWLFVSLASAAQLFGSFMLVLVLGQRNFAVGTTYAKTEAILTAVVGTVFFGAWLNTWAWVAVVLGVIGILAVSVQKSHLSWQQWFTEPTLITGLGAGLGFALASLWLREASLALQGHYLISAATTLLTMVFFQAVAATAWILWREPSSGILLVRHWRGGVFVGLTSVLGSIGWITAMTLQPAAYVKALGQVEFGLSLLITFLIFKEKITQVEWFGMCFVFASVVLLLLKGM